MYTHRMKFLINNKSINKVNLFSMLISGILLTVFILVAVYNSYIQYKNDIYTLEHEYIKSQKQFVEQETKRVLRYIEYQHKNNKTKSLEELQSEIVEVTEQMRNKHDGTGYVFIYTFDGVNVADPILKENAGKNLIDFTDINGKKVIKELIDISQKENGGYVDYVWNKPTTNKPAPKVSYAISYKPWKWMIGSGVYIDNVQDVIKEKKKEYYQQISKYLANTIVLVVIVFVIGVLIYRYLMSIVQDDIELIRKASQDLELVDTNNVSFKEFREVAHHLNIMNEELKDLNKNLEDKVIQRTKELEESRQYALNLVEQQDKFVKDAIHEINTPLSIIITNIDLFKMKFSENKYLSKIEAGSKIIHNIYNDLEYMVKKDRIEYPKENIDLSDFIRNRLDFFNEVAIGNQLSFKTDINSDISIDFNQTLLQRICDNTLSNAIKYSYKKEAIIVSLYKKDDIITFEVTNKGDTIKDTDKLFERFYRENDSRGGFGLGLNIIKEICDNNDVKLEIVSDNQLITFRYLLKVGK